MAILARRPRRLTPGYFGILAASFLIAVSAGWTSLAGRMDRDAYDWMSRAQPPIRHQPQSVVLAFDERTLAGMSYPRGIRPMLALALEQLADAKPAVVAIDILLSGETDLADDARLAAALAKTPNLILASDLIPNTNEWEDPAPAFAKAARAIGHVHAAPDPLSRVLPLELAGGRDRRWAMALEAARLKLGGGPLMESPDDIELGGALIPATRATNRAMFIRYREGIPVISVAQLRANPALGSQFRGKVVFVGITAQTAARDRLVTPLDDRPMSGVEIHAQAFETLVNRDFLRLAPLSVTVLTCLLLTALSGLVFAFLPGWKAYVGAVAVLLLAHVAPHVIFAQANLVMPYLSTVWSAWLSAVAAAGWQYFVVRRALEQSESDKQRYQQAIHFVTHEMRSPLTAIQGSSEMMGRYNLPEDKRKQMAQMINNESRRLAKMIQTFLDIERITDGQMEIKAEPFQLDDVVHGCVDRASVLAERKSIRLNLVTATQAFTIQGDRELMEYAVYNLLTNAVKYSAAETVVTITIQADSEGRARIAVCDQGMGMDEKELKNIGRKFYRTKRAEASGEVGTGIGLSLVQQIISHHKGKMEVASTLGVGSCFTIVLPAVAASGGGVPENDLQVPSDLHRN